MFNVVYFSGLGSLDSDKKCLALRENCKMSKQWLSTMFITCNNINKWDVTFSKEKLISCKSQQKCKVMTVYSLTPPLTVKEIQLDQTLKWNTLLYISPQHYCLTESHEGTWHSNLVWQSEFSAWSTCLWRIKTRRMSPWEKQEMIASRYLKLRTCSAVTL